MVEDNLTSQSVATDAEMFAARVQEAKDSTMLDRLWKT